MVPKVISSYQADELFSARELGQESVPISLDLGLSSEKIVIQNDGILMLDGQHLKWEQLAQVRENDTACFIIENNRINKIHSFSEKFNRYYSLMPTNSAPTMLISGIPMHRIKDTNPHLDTQSKIKALRAVKGRILDTTMGLGYTAIAAAKFAEEVTTVELDPTVLEICRLNPWSQELFSNPKINILLGDVFDLIGDFEDSSFAGILHDPPTFSLAGELYSADFYKQLWRVLRPSGRVFHYIGDPTSRSGRNTTRSVKNRLLATGFREVRSVPYAFGVVAKK